MKLDGLEICKHQTWSLLKHCKIYSFLVPFYFLFGSFFCFGATIPIMEPSMLEDMWVLIPLCFGGAVSFYWVGFALIKKVKAIKTELDKRDISDEDKVVAGGIVKKIFIASVAIIAVSVIVIVSAISGSVSNGSSGGRKPWQELGVSEREYMEIYNKIKYGE